MKYSVERNISLHVANVSEVHYATLDIEQSEILHVTKWRFIISELFFSFLTIDFE